LFFQEMVELKDKENWWRFWNSSEKFILVSNLFLVNRWLVTLIYRNPIWYQTLFTLFFNHVFLRGERDLLDNDIER
jgi:hypothetical protein